MDNPEDSSYLTLLNDGSQNFLLQSTEEVLGVPDSTLNVEPIFRDIEDGSGAWSVGLPILNLISEGDEPVDAPIKVTQDESEESTSDPLQLTQSTGSELSYPLQIAGKGFITADGLFISNDLLLHFNIEQGANGGGNDEEPSQNILINPKTLTPHDGEDENTEKQFQYLEQTSNTDEAEKLAESPVPETNRHNTDVIQLLNGDGTVINIHKNFINSDIDAEPSADDDDIDDDSDHTTLVYEQMCEVVMAQKCKQCSFLCEDQMEMIQHLKENHLKQCNISKLKSVKSEPVANENGVKLHSILNTNQNKNQQTVFLCSECDVGCNSIDKLKNHMIFVHKLAGVAPNAEQTLADNNVNSEMREQKPILDKKPVPFGRARTTATLIKRQHSLARKIKCSIKGCEIRFPDDELRKRHEQCHVNGQKKQYKCFECGNKFSIWRICSLHLWKCHKIDMGLLTCPMCDNFKTAAPFKLLHHMVIHEGEKPYLCNQCGKSFKQVSQLRNHQMSHCDPLTLPDWATQRQCDTCKKYFASTKSLKKHIQCVHDKFKPFICNVCGHKAARKAMLELHLRQHTGEKPHKCSRCEYKTGDHNSLRRHMMRHSGDKKYSCPHCTYQSIQSTAYKKHIANKHPGLGGSYFCAVCSYHTVNENIYRSHIIEHANEQKSNQKLNSRVQIIGGLNCVENTTQDKQQDEEMQNCFLTLENADETVDTGGITIPAGYELQVPF